MFGFGFPEVTAPLAPASAPSCYQTSRLFNCATGGTLACPRLGRAALFDPGPAVRGSIFRLSGDQYSIIHAKIWPVDTVGVLILL